MLLTLFSEVRREIRGEVLGGELIVPVDVPDAVSHERPQPVVEHRVLLGVLVVILGFATRL